MTQTDAQLAQLRSRRPVVFSNYRTAIGGPNEIARKSELNMIDAMIKRLSALASARHRAPG